MEKIKFELSEAQGTVEFYVLEQTKLNGMQYILVTEEEAGDADAYILKDISPEDMEEALYEMVEDDTELEAVAGIFEKMLEDIELTQ